MPNVRVNLPDAPYDVVVEPGLLTSIGARLAAQARSRIAIVVIDAKVAQYYRVPLLTTLGAGFDRIIECTMQAGEDRKTVETVNRLYGEILAQQIDRHTPLLAVGGGVVGDTAGFVAATLLRGVPLVQIPTSLLAMVDASVGGKVGVNHGRYKNMVGAFKQPVMVLIDPEVLHTLGDAEFRNGLAECIKHAVIRDADLFAEMERDLPRVFQREPTYLAGLITRNVAIKARVVEADVHEQAERAHLNFGHTFGHAIETVSNHEYAHGEAIALGMCAACHVARRLDMLDEESRLRIVRLLSRAGLPTTGLDLDDTVLYSAMLHDKKTTNSRIRLILPDRIGNVSIRDDVPRVLVIDALNSLRSE